MQPTIATITDSATGSKAQILISLGFNCFSWQPVLEDGAREMLWSHPEFAGGNERPSGSGIPLLFPFPGRISGAKYEFGGQPYELEPGDQFGNAIHGFVHKRPWRIVEQTGNRVVGEFQASMDDPTILKSWPADFSIRVGYEVKGSELVCDVEYGNKGNGPLPCGLGTHAYFRLPLAEGSNAADTEISVPTYKTWEENQLIPTGKLLPVGEMQRLWAGLRLADHKFDTYFSDVRPDPDGHIRTYLNDPRSGRTLTQTYDAMFGQCVVYTPPHREAVCVEPYSCIADAIRLSAEGFDTGLQTLQPGESRKTTIRIGIEG